MEKVGNSFMFFLRVYSKSKEMAQRCRGYTTKTTDRIAHTERPLQYTPHQSGGERPIVEKHENQAIQFMENV